ncbi:hypothetical protein E2C01_048908 [Portunus trituberculatus]|uniref:Tubulin-folding cofactor D C-terminal domain-containing protein n=1 Tax=Portunus trituberculatus TaxID=210409 RepID=A0A5B7GCE9_PORTR|nr:hypothetical protein [Portunus trituberculatus]
MVEAEGRDNLCEPSVLSGLPESLAYEIFTSPLNIFLLRILTKMVLVKDPCLLSKEIVREMMARVCQQATERIDRTRKVAGTAFAALLHRHLDLLIIVYLSCISINNATEH